MQLTIGAEQAPDGEDAVIKELAALQVGIMQKTDPTRRGQHPKHHGCTAAELTILDDIPAPYKVGLFKEPRTYRARVRWSNGASADDQLPDVHGMAVKVLEVTGPKALEDAAPDEQDFVMVDNEIFFVPDVQTMLDLMKARAAAAVKPEVMAEFSKTHPSIMPLLNAAKKTIASPFAVQYWSTVAYKLGDQAVKYTAVPAGDNGAADSAPPSENYLRATMAARLAEGRTPVTFQLLILPQTDAATMPIEDPTVPWSSAPVPVATLTVRPQDFATPGLMTQCEGSSFDPWHALAEHRPLGGINRARKAVYKASVALRHGPRPPASA